MSAMERRSGGQGLVQFMRAANSEEALAVKFFFKKAAFDAEVLITSSSADVNFTRGCVCAASRFSQHAYGCTTRKHRVPPMHFLASSRMLTWRQVASGGAVRGASAAQHDARHQGLCRQRSTQCTVRQWLRVAPMHHHRTWGEPAGVGAA